MAPTRHAASAEAWLQWFEVYQYTQCRTYLCATFGLDSHDADALINVARLRVFLYWETIKAPLAYFRTVLKHEVWKHLHALAHERTRLKAYACQQQFHTRNAARTAYKVAKVLEQAQPAQRRLLEWFVQGCDDGQVAEWLGNTPHAVRQARHAAYVELRKSVV